MHSHGNSFSGTKDGTEQECLLIRRILSAYPGDPER